MIRLIRSEDGAVAPDVTGRLIGPAVWVVADREQIEKAISSKRFVAALAEAFGAPVKAPSSPEAFAELCDRRLRDHLAHLLGLEHKARRLVIGVERSRHALASGAATQAILAIDAAPNSARTIDGLCGGQRSAHVFRLLNRREIGRALGRDLVGCVAFDRSEVVTRLPEELLRLAAFRGKALPGSGGPQIQSVTAPVEEQDG